MLARQVLYLLSNPQPFFSFSYFSNRISQSLLRLALGKDPTTSDSWVAGITHAHLHPWHQSGIFSKKWSTGFSPSPVILHLEICSWEMKKKSLHKDISTRVHSGTNQTVRVETTQRPISNEWINKIRSIHARDNYSTNEGKEVPIYSVDGPWRHHAKLKEAATKPQTVWVHVHECPE